MTVFNDYQTGTVSVGAGGTAVTGSGTAWQLADIGPGDTFMKAGYAVVIESVASDTSLTLSEPWPGAALSGDTYRIRYQPDGSRYTAAAVAVIEQLAGGSIAALGDVTGEANKFPYFTGPDAMGLAALTSFARNLLDDTDAAAVLATLGFSSFFQSIINAADAAATRTAIGANDASNLNAGAVPVDRIPATLTPDKAYRQGNIIGTVSQSGGVPTGDLVEVGSNANGNYLLIAGGLAICSVVVDVDLTSSSNQLFPLPINFSVVPVPSWGHNDSKSGTDLSALEDAFIDIDLANGNWRWRCPGTGTNASSSCILGAIGRWA